MKFQTRAGVLAKALRNLAPVIERSSTIPIAGCVQFKDNYICGTDLDMELKIAVPVDNACGSIAIDFSTLYRLVRNISADDTITITGGKYEATIDFASGRYDIPTLPSSDFPNLNICRFKKTRIDGEGLKTALKFVKPFISSEETRYYLNGVCLDGNVAVATNGHQLVCHPLDFEAPEGRFIIPHKAAALLNMLPAPIAMKYSDKPALCFQMPGFELLTKTIDGVFPDWRRVTPKKIDNVSKLTIDRTELSAAIKRALALMQISSSHGTLAWKDGRTVLVGKNINQAVVREYLDKTFMCSKGQDIVTFNMRYMKDILAIFRGVETISAQIIDESQPIFFKADGEAFSLLMPVRGSDREITFKTINDLCAAQEISKAA